MGEGILIAGAETTVSAGGSGFTRRDGWMHADDVPFAELAARYGTPSYVYSASIVRAQYARLDAALGAVPHRLHYSVKANGNLALLALLRELGAGVDIVSGGELFRAKQAGFRGADVVFSGVGKTEREIREALESDIFLFNVESVGELELIELVA